MAKMSRRKKIRIAFTRGGRAIKGAIDHWFGRRSYIGNDEIIDATHFPWAAELEKQWPVIRRELDAVLEDRDGIPELVDFSPAQRYLAKEGHWKSFFLAVYGELPLENRRSCPETTRLLDTIPDLEVAFFSILSPGKHIPPHFGFYKGLVRAHLGLIVPKPREAVYMRVGQSMVHWDEGKVVVFDDTYEHEVRNDTDEWRVVLIIDVARPYPFPLDKLNALVLRIARKTPFISGPLKKHRAWEKEYYAKATERKAGDTPA